MDDCLAHAARVHDLEPALALNIKRRWSLVAAAPPKGAHRRANVVMNVEDLVVIDGIERGMVGHETPT